MFTAVLLTREIFNHKHDKKQEVKFTKSFIDRFFGNAKYAFIPNRKKAYIFIVLFAIVGTLSIFTRGFDMGVDFKGGRSYVVTFDKNVNGPEIKETLDKFLDNKTIVKTYGQPNQVQITTSYLYGETESPEKAKSNDSIVLSKLYEGSKTIYNKAPNFDQFVLSNVSNFRKIDATIADEIKNSSSTVALIAFTFIFLYISVRFSRWQFAIAAIICLIHDALITLGVLSLLKDIVPFSLEMNQTIIAAILTIIGFSTNDTVVIFDRIREFTKRNPHMPLADLFNNAVNNTLGRTFTTAFTLFVTSMILFFFGGESIRGFAFTMTIGVFVGTLSSIFIAAPLTLDLIEKFSKKK
jgi:SecD/SecF fusion protein